MDPKQELDAVLPDLDRFFMGESSVHKAAQKIAECLGKSGAEFAIAGSLAAAAHGHVRATVDVDVLVTSEGLEAFKRTWLGRGYAEKFPGSRGVRDTENNVAVDFLIAGGFPGDGKPKPVVFPNPASVAVRSGGYPVLSLPCLVELKLASGMSAAHRLQDLADVIALIRANRLDSEFASELNPWVRARFAEMLGLAAAKDAQE